MCGGLFVNAICIYYYNTEKQMASNILHSVTDTLTRKPEYGIVSSMLSISMSTTEMLQLVGVIIGLFIAIITAVLKVIELRDKLKEKRRIKKLKQLVEEASLEDADDYGDPI
jgi:hypothetical protein